jgi:hypothetical protein
MPPKQPDPKVDQDNKDDIQYTEDAYSADFDECANCGMESPGLEPGDQIEFGLKGNFPPGSTLHMLDQPLGAPGTRGDARPLYERILAMFFRSPEVASSFGQGGGERIAAMRTSPSTPAYGGGGQATVPNTSGRCFTLATRSMTPTRARLSLTVLPTALPGMSTLQLTTKKGRSVSLPAVKVVGRWQYDLTADNGWRVQMTPKPVAAKAKELTYAVVFFKDKETKPFQQRDGTLSLSEDRCETIDPAMSFSFGEVKQEEDECTRIQARANEIATRMQAGDATAMNEFMAIQEKMSACTVKMITAQTAQMQKMTTAAGQQQMQAEQDNAGCSSVTLTPGAAGTVKGMLYCSKNFGYPKVTGTMKYIRGK